MTELSVVMLVGTRRRRAERALGRILEQSTGMDCEVIIVEAVPSQHPPLAGSNQPKVQAIRPAGSQHFGQMRNAALQAAKGKYVAFLEDHVLIEPGFLQAVQDAFRDGWEMVGPSVRNANPNVGVSNAVHLMHYGWWDGSRRPGPATLLPGNNSAFRTDALERYGKRVASLLLTDTVLQMRLQEDGVRMFHQPVAILSHLNATSLRTALRSEYLYQRCFAASRALAFGWSRLKRFGVAARTPLVPWVRLLRLLEFALERDLLRWGRLLAALPALIALHQAAALGQLVGLMRGIGGAGQRFTDFELNYRRPVAAGS